MTTSKFKQVLLLQGFQKDMKRLLKHFRTLNDDLKTFVETELFLYHKLKIDNTGIFHIPGLGFSTPRIYKAKKFACKSLKRYWEQFWYKNNIRVLRRGGQSRVN